MTRAPTSLGAKRHVTYEAVGAPTSPRLPRPWPASQTSGVAAIGPRARPKFAAKAIAYTPKCGLPIRIIAHAGDVNAAVIPTLPWASIPGRLGHRRVISTTYGRRGISRPTLAAASACHAGGPARLTRPRHGLIVVLPYASPRNRRPANGLARADPQAIRVPGRLAKPIAKTLIRSTIGLVNIGLAKAYPPIACVCQTHWGSLRATTHFQMGERARKRGSCGRTPRGVICLLCSSS